jgi:hypothetical protein
MLAMNSSLSDAISGIGPHIRYVALGVGQRGELDCGRLRHVVVA